jgi:hypothetical protein
LILKRSDKIYVLASPGWSYFSCWKSCE